MKMGSKKNLKTDNVPYVQNVLNVILTEFALIDSVQDHRDAYVFLDLWRKFTLRTYRESYELSNEEMSYTPSNISAEKNKAPAVLSLKLTLKPRKKHVRTKRTEKRGSVSELD